MGVLDQWFGLGVVVPPTQQLTRAAQPPDPWAAVMGAGFKVH